MAKKPRKLKPQPLSEPISQKNRIWLAAAFGVVCLIVYALTLQTGLAGGDSGELTLALKSFGIAHPPGYPTYLLFGKALTLLPWGGLSLKASLYSALCDSVATALLFWWVGEITGSALAGLLSASAFAFSPLVWPYAVVPEVFGLNHVFCIGLFVLLRSLSQSFSTRKLYGIFLWMGLGLGNHHTFLFFVLPSTLFLIPQLRVRIKEKGSAKLLLGCILAFLIGFVPPYSYLVWASYNPSLHQWGDLRTWDGFLKHFLRQEYGTFQLSSVATDHSYSWFDYLGHFLTHAAQGLGGLYLLLGAFGLISLLRKKKYDQLKWSLLLVFYLGVYCSLANLDINFPLHSHVLTCFWQQPWILVCIYAGFGWAALETACRKQRRWREMAIPLAGVMLALPLVSHWERCSQKSNSAFSLFSREVLTELPHGALLLASGDDVYANLLYTQEEEGIRTDIEILNPMHFSSTWYDRLARSRFDSILGENLEETTLVSFLSSQKKLHRVFWVDQNKLSDPEAKLQFKFVPYGLSQEIIANDQMPSALTQDWKETNLRLSALKNAEGLQSFPQDSWENHLYKVYYEQINGFATTWLADLTVHPSDPNQIKSALGLLEKSGPILLQNHVIKDPESLYLNLVVGYSNLPRNYPGAVQGLFENGNLFLKWAPLNHPNRPNVQAILAELKGH